MHKGENELGPLGNFFLGPQPDLIRKMGENEGFFSRLLPT